MQVTSEDPFSPFTAHASDQPAPFFTLSRSANSLRGVFFTLSRPANCLRGVFSTFSRSANSLRGPFFIVARSANCQRGPFSTLSCCANCQRGPFSPLSRSANSLRGVFFIVARCANPEQRSLLPPCTSCRAIAGGLSPHSPTLPTAGNQLFPFVLYPDYSNPLPSVKGKSPENPKKPPFCSSLALLTAKIPPFPQLERKEDWQPRRCPKGKNKKAALEKGEVYTSLGG